MTPVDGPGIPMRLPVGLDGGVRLDGPLHPARSTRLDATELGATSNANSADGTQSPFEKLLVDSLHKTNEKLVVAEQAATDFASGKSDDIHGTMIAVTEADIQLRLVGSMRNRIVDAFNEIWRMQV